MNYDLLQNLIVALAGIGALLFLLDHFAPSLRRRLAASLQRHSATAALGRRLQPRGGGHCGSGDDGSCGSCSGDSCGDKPRHR